MDDILLKLAVVKSDLGMYAEAKKLLQEALALQPHPDGSGLPTEKVATLLGNLGAIGLAQGNHAEARLFFERAIAIRRQLGIDRTGDGFVCHFHLATCLSFMGDHAGARRLVDEVEPYLKADLGSATTMSPLHYLLAATLLMDMGHFDEATVYNEEALRRLLQTYGEQHPHTAKALQGIGQLRQLQGLYTQALPFFDRALGVWRKISGQELEIAVTTNSLGQLHEALGHHEQALRYYEEALKLRRRTLGYEHLLVAESLNNIGGVLLALDQLEQAAQAYEQSFTLRQKALAANHPQMSNAHAGLANVFSHQGRQKEALHHYQKSLEICNHGTGAPGLDLGLAEKNMGMQLLKMNCAREALPYLERAVTLLKNTYGPAHRHTEDGLLSLALTLATCGNERRAFDLMVEAGSASSSRLGQIFGLSSEKQRGEQIKGAHTILQFMLQLAVQIRERAGMPVPAVEQAAFHQIQRLKGIEAEVLLLQAESIAASYPALAQHIQALATLRNKMAHLALVASSGQIASEPSPRKALMQLAMQREEIEARLAAQIPELAAQRRLHACDLATLSAALPAGSVLVEYLHTPCLNFQASLDRPEEYHDRDRYLAFVLPASHPELVRMIDLGDATHIDGLVSRCRDLFGRPPERRPKHTSDERQQLRQAVFDPLLPALGGCTRLLIAPDVGLAVFPLEALSLASGRVLLDDYQISYLACGRDLLRFQTPRIGQAGPPVVVAAPDFELRAERPTSSAIIAFLSGWTKENQPPIFAPLPGTKAEGKAVADLLNIRPWLGREALKEPLKRLRSPRVLHLATHGMNLPHPRLQKTSGLVPISATTRDQDNVPYLENALYRSALAFAGVNTWLRHQSTPEEAGNGLLTAEEVCSLNLLDTEIVVLSACETGMGDLQMGEGVMGLRWAFTVAGARTLVASLWKVDDEATCALMIEFYRLLRSPQSADTALRTAQKSIRRRWPDPYFWSAFICQGDPAFVPRLTP